MSDLERQVRKLLLAGGETKVPPTLQLKRCILEQAALRYLVGGGIHRQIHQHIELRGARAGSVYIAFIGDMIRELGKKGLLNVTTAGHHITRVLITEKGLAKLKELLESEHTNRDVYLQALYELD
jgi:DNA-binding PadR family transcriptional regulator